MNESANTGGSSALMETCTLSLYQKNIFRVTGLPVDATPKEVARQTQKLQMLEEMGGGAANIQAAFSLAVPPTTEQLRAALSRMKHPEQRLVDEFFWFWPEEFGTGKPDPAIQAMLAGDTRGAVVLWREREKNGSHAALHNMAVMYHMYAVDWTEYQLTGDLDAEHEALVRQYWGKSAERWEKLADAEPFWDLLRQRVLSLGDDALTTGFVRRIQKELPDALDRVNAEAALKLAERDLTGWAKFHIDHMRETHQGLDHVDRTCEAVLEPSKRRLGHHLKSFKEQADKTPERGADLAVQLLDQCRPIMDLFDLFHGQETHQRKDLFDNVAETVLLMAISHQRSTDDNSTFVKLLNESLGLASGPNIRARIIQNISIGEKNLKGKLIASLLKEVDELAGSVRTPAEKFALFKETIMPKVPGYAMEAGIGSPVYDELMDSLAMALRNIAIDAHNRSKDAKTSLEAIALAAKLGIDEVFKKRISADKTVIEETYGGLTCFYCGHEPGVSSRVVSIPMHKVTDFTSGGIRYSSLPVQVPRCESCYKQQRKHWKVAMWSAALGLLVGPFVIPGSAVAGAVIAILVVGGKISSLIFKNDGGDGRAGCLSIGGTLFAAALCGSALGEEAMGREIWINMAGAGVVIAFVTFWIARLVMHKASPETLAMDYERIGTMQKDGWKTGAKPG